ncbi:hypothetical protein [Kordia jejudonensis]|uniref:hypothetical protein n=1 Tax=Kordia jejudonensis TaxID=1348245 RepID=UPI000629A46E|nr:hypothetical protein [Kordia jejudonensis]
MAKQPEKKTGLKNALEKLNNAIEDLTSLHVQTYTGTLDITIDDTKGFSSIKDEIKAAANKKDGQLILVAETLAKFDGDSYNFVKKDLDEVPAVTLEVHKNAVKAGIETRIGLLELFKGVFN